MNKYIRNYFTLNELFDGEFTPNKVQEIADDEVINAPDFDEKFNDVIYSFAQMYDDWYIGYIDKFIRFGIPPVEPTEEEVNKIKINFVKKVVYIYNFTSERYLVLLNLYEEHKNNLLNRLSSTTISTNTHRVNDTPQNSGDFSGEDFTSVWEENTNNVSTVSNPETIMERLDEIQRKYMNVLADWANEFKSLFIAPNDEW